MNASIKALLCSSLVFSVGCSDELNHTISMQELQEAEWDVGISQKDRKSTFSIVGGVAQALDMEWVYFVEGEYEGVKTFKGLKLMSADKFFCPTMLKIDQANGALSYTLQDGADKHYSKAQSDKCVVYYANLFDESMRTEVALSSENSNTYR